ncbi:MAG TPA: VOC family protein [Actinomycetes bacterium]|nr:VOC family protein [Actinomycetes bacterium]
MSDSIVLNSATLDCQNAGRLADFYAEITGGEVTFRSEGWATIKGPGGRLNFQTAPGYQPPTWPDEASSMQIHLDFDVDDLGATEARVLAAGATKFGYQPNEHCLVFADPAGHPFCLSTDDVPDQV